MTNDTTKRTETQSTLPLSCQLIAVSVEDARRVKRKARRYLTSGKPWEYIAGAIIKWCLKSLDIWES